MPSSIRINTLAGHFEASSSDRSLNQFLSHVQLCQIQSEIVGVQFFDQRLAQDTPEYADWLRKMENTIQTWLSSSAVHDDSPTSLINTADQCRLLLYRPCSRNIVPSESDLQMASALAINIIRCSWEIVRASSSLSVPTFQCVFNVFQAGMILLYALRNHGVMVRDSDLGEQAHASLELLTPLFVSISNCIMNYSLRLINNAHGSCRIFCLQGGLLLLTPVVMLRSSGTPFFAASKQVNSLDSQPTTSVCLLSWTSWSHNAGSTVCTTEISTYYHPKTPCILSLLHGPH